MSLAQIHALIPHRDPFLLLDEIVEQTPSTIHCRRKFTGQECSIRAIPELSTDTCVLLCESCLQAGAVLLAQQSADYGRKSPSHAHHETTSSLKDGPTGGHD